MNASARAELDEAGRHLAATGVVHADEEDLGLLLRRHPLRLRERPQPLAREAVREHRHEDVDLGVTEQVGRLGDVAGNRLVGEDARELLCSASAAWSM